MKFKVLNSDFFPNSNDSFPTKISFLPLNYHLHLIHLESEKKKSTAKVKNYF